MENSFLQIAKELLWGKIDFNDFESGGVQCQQYMSMTFKLTISFASLFMYALIIKSLFKKIQYHSSAVYSPCSVEYYLGYFGLFLYFAQLALKSLVSQSAMFMLNPCHTITLVQSICLISKNTKGIKLVNLIITNNLFCGWTAMYNPLTTGLTELEIILFWIEHILLSVINPIVLIYHGRYFDINTLRFDYHVFSFCFFGLYQRIFLFPISELTLVNLNFTICPSLGDPFASFLGKWYYTGADFYLFFGAQLMRWLYKGIYLALGSLNLIKYINCHQVQSRKQDEKSE